jgi:hypothetical protein
MIRAFLSHFEAVMPRNEASRRKARLVAEDEILRLRAQNDTLIILDH